MAKFVQVLQVLIALVIGAFVGYDIVLNGISLFEDKYVVMTCSLLALLELALLVIYKLIEDD